MSKDEYQKAYASFVQLCRDSWLCGIQLSKVQEMCPNQITKDLAFDIYKAQHMQLIQRAACKSQREKDLGL